jgi:endonuclease/exonuclease/phosphatase family metal-dependent hydrolase
MRQALLVAVGAFFLAAPTGYREPMAEDGFDAPPVRLTPATAADGVPLRVMTYNVAAMPWPLAGDRTTELATIGDRLRKMRAQGDAPDVVVLQEAFTGGGRAIAARAGYDHVVFGPDSDAAVAGDPGKPMPEQYRSRGEGLGAWLSSGLVLMSDHPILGVERAAYPRNACAGYDCLANKGVLLARIRVPGLARPVQIVTTHMNARAQATGTPEPHANEAYRRQMRALGDFIATHRDPRLPLIIAADLNVRADPVRIAALRRNSAQWSKTGLDPAPIFAICGKPSIPCRPGIGFDAIRANTRNNDWQLSFSGSDASVTPVTAAIRFMPDPDARVLSDHQAVMVDYRLAPLAKRAL